MSQFYALMSDNTVKHISLKEEIVTEIKNIFINGGAIFKPEGIEEDVFDGNIISRNGENITYVHYDLPEDFARIPYNQADMSEGEFYQFNLSSCIRQQNSLTAQFVSFSLSNLANIFYPPQFLQ